MRTEMDAVIGNYLAYNKQCCSCVFAIAYYSSDREHVDKHGAQQLPLRPVAVNPPSYFARAPSLTWVLSGPTV